MKIFSINSSSSTNHINKVLNDIVLLIKTYNIGILPTDTIYGLVGICGQEDVIKRLYEVKYRPSYKNFILQVHDKLSLKKIVENFDERLEKIIDAFLPGGLTLVCKASKFLKNEYKWDSDTVAVRIPDHKVLLSILKVLDQPLIVTSANISGQKTANNFKDVVSIFKNKIDFALNTNCTCNTTPSTIIDFTKEKITVLREGVISAEKIFKIINS
ncbi:L-threonylcarbamoyladenylate synthase [bacterium]